MRNSLLTLFILVMVVVGFYLLTRQNSRQIQPLVVVIPTQVAPIESTNSWQSLLQGGFGEGSTPLPTVAIPVQPFVAPTLGVSSDGVGLPVPLQPNEIGVRPTDPVGVAITLTPVPVTPTPLGEVILDETGQEIPLVFTEQPLSLSTPIWQPPPLIPPISRDPQGRDHYWFSRPVDSNATNFGLFYYTYGADGPDKDNPWRVHHGIDMPNPIGESVRAVGSGQVIWAADSLRVESEDIFQNSPSYGNVVVIQHDFGYNGQPLYTLYAHLSAVLITRNQFVERGDVIGLVGSTGRVSGPHVHFEVRMGENAYGSTYNPLLWIVPYVGHGVIAGSLTDELGEPLSDYEVTLRKWSSGLIEDTTTTYVFSETVSTVNSDPRWYENFVFADVPEGRYEVVASFNSKRLSKVVDVVEGLTSFVELTGQLAATPLPTDGLPTATPIN
ncbi:MAG: peptidoglycan DD-metalloendopeptidase family protein [Phototrophicaceae bacterium]